MKKHLRTALVLSSTFAMVALASAADTSGTTGSAGTTIPTTDGPNTGAILSTQPSLSGTDSTSNTNTLDNTTAIDGTGRRKPVTRRGLRTHQSAPRRANQNPDGTFNSAPVAPMTNDMNNP